MKAYARVCVALALCLGLGMPLVAWASEEPSPGNPDQVAAEIVSQEPVSAAEEADELSNGGVVDGFLSINLTNDIQSQTVSFTAPITGYYTMLLSESTETENYVTVSVEDVEAKTQLGAVHLNKAGVETEPVIYLEALREYDFTFSGKDVVAALTLQCTTTEAPDCFTVEDGVLTNYTGKLATIRIPEGVTSISPDAYSAIAHSASYTAYQSSDAYSLGSVSLRLPASMVDISTETLNYENMGNESLRAASILVSEDSQNFSSVDGVLYNKDGTKLIAAPTCLKGKLTVPNGVTTIGTYAFAYGSLTEVVLPNTVETIEKSAFQNAAITEIDLPDSVKTIGDYAFSYVGWMGSSSLKKVALGAGVETIGSCAFKMMQDSELVLPKSVKSVDYSAFEDCPELTKLTIQGETIIGRDSFRGCPKLKTLTINGNASVYSESSFGNCPLLTTFKLGCGATEWHIDGNCLIRESTVFDIYDDESKDVKVIELVAASKEPIDFVIPNDVYGLTSSALDNVAAINELGVGRSCKDVSCAIKYNLTSISVATGNPIYSVRDGVLYSREVKGYNAHGPVYSDYDLVRFPMGSMRTKFTVPDDVKYICESAFANYSEETPRTLIEVAISGVTSLAYNNVFETIYGEGETPLTIVSYTDSSAERYYKDYAEKEHLNWAALPKDTIEITLDANGGRIDGSLTKTVTLNEGDPIGKLPTPERDGSVFLGWFDEKTGGNQVFEEDYFYWYATLYAQWEEPIALLGRSSEQKKDIEVTGCTWGDNWLANDPAKYNHSLATTMCVLSSAAYSKDASMEDLKRLGCAAGDIELHFPTNNHTDKDFYTPDRDRVGYAFGTKYLADGTPVVFVLVRGTVQNIEWESNFNVADTTYPNDYHEGFIQAYGYLRDDLISYLTAMNVDPSRAKFLVTGHSRGAAVANILGHTLNNGAIATSLGKSNAGNIYVYTFACPKCVKGGSIEGNIFNIVNPEDTVPRVALGKWGFARFGRTLVLPGKSERCKRYTTLAAQMRERFVELAGTNYVPYHEGSQTSVGFEKAFGYAVPAVSDYMTDKLYYKIVIPDVGYIERGGFTVSEAFQAIGCIDALGGGRPVKDGPDIAFADVLLALAATKPAMTARLLCAVFDETIDLGVVLTLHGLGINILPTGSNVGTPFTHAHTPETYMAWMLEGGEYMYTEGYTGVKIGCPVDIEVTDSSDTVVCKIVDDVVDDEIMSRIDGLAASVEDGVKTIDIPMDGHYTIYVTATDDGEMDVTATEMDGEGESLSQVSYADIPLAEGDNDRVLVWREPYNYNVSDWVELYSESIGWANPTFKVSQDEISAVSIGLSVGSGEGSVDGPTSAILGDQATVCAAAAQGWHFSGWYEDGELVSSEEVWTFLVDADRELEARFAEGEGSVSPEWKRLAGSGRYDTMAEIVSEGWSGQTGGTVVVATGEGFKDALAAAGLAGLDGGPVVLTAGKSLSRQAESQLKALKPSKVYVAGGTFAVSDGVLSSIQKATGVEPVRVAGKTSASTSAELALAGKGRWDGTAIIATNKSFKDALSVAPVSYAKRWPILLADNGKSLNKDVIAALKACGIRRAYVVGGELAVTKNVVSQLEANGVELAGRLAGANGVETSRRIADFALDNGLTVANMAFATSQNFPDALAGAALCGKNGSVLLLCDDKAPGNLSFATDHASQIECGYVFGGELAFSKALFDRLPR